MPDNEGNYRIPSYAMGRLQDKIEKLARRAKKLGKSPIELRIVSQEDVPDTTNPFKIYRFYIVHVTGERPIIAGWAFVGTLQHVPDVGNIVRTIPGESLPLDYRTKEAWCDHCKTNRYRKDTYVVRNTETDELKQVGSNCLDDFLGHHDPKGLASIAEMWTLINEVMEAEEEYDGHGPRETFYIDMIGYLQFVAAVIRERGWLSKSKARDVGSLSTADDAFDEMFPPKDRPEWKIIKPTEEDTKTVDETLAWAEENLLSVDVSSLSDYYYNLRVVIASGVLEHRTLGLAASLIPTALRAMEREKELKHSRQTSHYFGTVDKREVFTVTILGVNRVEGQWGVTHIYKLVDLDGNQATWFASHADLAVDKTYKIKATVKAHDLWQGIERTILTRVKIEKEIEDGQTA